MNHSFVHRHPLVSAGFSVRVFGAPSRLLTLKALAKWSEMIYISNFSCKGSPIHCLLVV